MALPPGFYTLIQAHTLCGAAGGHCCRLRLELCGVPHLAALVLMTLAAHRRGMLRLCHLDAGAGCSLAAGLMGLAWHFNWRALIWLPQVDWPACSAGFAVGNHQPSW